MKNEAVCIANYTHTYTGWYDTNTYTDYPTRTITFKKGNLYKYEDKTVLGYATSIWVYNESDMEYFGGKTKFEDYFMPLSKWREKQINEIINDCL